MRAELAARSLMALKLDATPEAMGFQQINESDRMLLLNHLHNDMKCEKQSPHLQSVLYLSTGSIQHFQLLPVEIGKLKSCNKLLLILEGTGPTISSAEPLCRLALGIAQQASVQTEWLPFEAASKCL